MLVVCRLQCTIQHNLQQAPYHSSISMHPISQNTLHRQELRKVMAVIVHGIR